MRHKEYAMRRNSVFGAGCLLAILLLAAYVGCFFWYANTVIPHTTPTGYNNFWYGLLHGLFVLPTFVCSLFVDGITIYQAPNNGGWYNFGFLLGVGLLLGSGTSSSRRN